MPFRPNARALRVAMILLPSAVTLAALTATAAVAVSLQESSIRAATAERVREVATSLAGIEEVKSALVAVSSAGTPAALADADDLAEATAALQPIADLIGQAAGVYYVVVTDDEGVRITHPVATERGRQVATTNASVLAGTPFLGTETGPSGPSLRAKVPVRSSDGDIVGMVAVGILESDIEAQRSEALAGLLPWALGALVVGTIASSVLTVAVERRFRRFDDVAAEHDRMQRTTAALREQSHEFHTRLHVVHGLVTRGDTGEALDYIEDLVAVTGSSRGGERTRSEGSGLRDATMHAVRSELVGRGVQAEFDWDPAVVFDDDLVSVLTNLCRNAGDAGASRVRCALAVSDGRLRGSVEDDGPGVDPRAASRIFTRGFSSKPDATGWGRGVGLDLVRRIVTSREGAIEVGRSPELGARFSFEMAAR